MRKFRTRMTEILGIEYPIMMGTMQRWSTPELVAAVANAGAFACLPSASYVNGNELREAIKRTSAMTDQPFGVNINLFPMLRPVSNEEYVDITLEEGVRVIETSGRSPEPFVDRIRKGGAIHMHKAARVRDARTAERLGVSIVEIVGFECAGHPSREQIGSLVLIPQAVDAVKIPVVAGGGIADGRGLVAALALGAEGVCLGTRFLASRECEIHPSVKERLADAQSTDTALVLGSLADPMRALRTDLVSQVLKMEEEGASMDEVLLMVAGEKSARAMAAGDIDNALLACGQVVGMLHDAPTVKEIIEGIMAKAAAVSGSLNGILGSR
ncbi:MAG: nitronate monooxygenase [Dehalococcoidia bacterium]|nr:nitronate monooxygenase [Dehalococcoidia bacterium]